MAFVVLLIQAVLVTAWLVVLGRVIASWIDPAFERPVSQYLYSVTEPILAPIRERLPRTGMLDLTPLLVLLGLGIILRFVLAA